MFPRSTVVLFHLKWHHFLHRHTFNKLCSCSPNSNSMWLVAGFFQCWNLQRKRKFSVNLSDELFPRLKIWLKVSRIRSFLNSFSKIDFVYISPAEFHLQWCETETLVCSGINIRRESLLLFLFARCSFNFQIAIWTTFIFSEILWQLLSEILLTGCFIALRAKNNGEL